MDFLAEFKNVLCRQAVKGAVFDALDKNCSTKDKSVVVKKLTHLETLMYTFFNIKAEDLEDMNVFEFLKANVNPKIHPMDIGFHIDNLKAWTVGIKDSATLNDVKNRPSMIAISVYASENEEVCDDETMIEWFADYERRNPAYLLNQKDNYLYMKKDLRQFIAAHDRRR